MVMQLIGAGFGRTGTLSLKGAIEMLDAGPCYHMLEVGRNARHAKLWHDAATGQPVDWDALFSDYAATVDWPACYFWRELVARYPDAKVLLSVSSPEKWYKSVHDTIYQSIGSAPETANDAIHEMLTMARTIVLEKTFGGRFGDREHAMMVFERHNAAVKEAIPRDRLLVYEIGSGWEPLCAFLDRPVPSEDFPHLNTSESFRERIETMRDQLGD